MQVVKEDANKSAVTMTYEELGSMEMFQIIQKISHTPTTAQKAAGLRKVSNEFIKIREKIVKDYDEQILQKFFKKNEKGELERSETGDYICLEGQDKACADAQLEFGKTEVPIEYQFNMQLLSDMKSITAKEINILGKLLVEDGPGLPM